MIHIYYGDGKGKTSALNGSAIRATGAGLKVGYFRFLKGQKSSENKILKSIVSDFKQFQTSQKFVITMDAKEKLTTRDESQIGMNYILSNSRNLDLIILDEFIDLQANTVNLFTLEQLMTFLNKIEDKEVLISGHELPEPFKIKADLITHFNSEKHYYKDGIKAKKGIEF